MFDLMVKIISLGLTTLWLACIVVNPRIMLWVGLFLSVVGFVVAVISGIDEKE